MFGRFTSFCVLTANYLKWVDDLAIKVCLGRSSMGLDGLPSGAGKRGLRTECLGSSHINLSGWDVYGQRTTCVANVIFCEETLFFSYRFLVGGRHAMVNQSSNDELSNCFLFIHDLDNHDQFCLLKGSSVTWSDGLTRSLQSLEIRFSWRSNT